MPRNYQKRPKATKEEKLANARARQQRWRDRKRGIASLPPTRSFSQTPCRDADETPFLQTSTLLPAYHQADPNAQQRGFWEHNFQEHQRTGERDELEKTLSTPGSYADTQDVLTQASGMTDQLDHTLSAPSIPNDVQDTLMLDDAQVNADMRQLLDSSAAETQDAMMLDDAPSEHSTNGDTLQLPSSPVNEVHDGTVLWLASEIAAIRMGSNMSDMAIEKLFKLLIRRNADIMRLYREGAITDSYLNSVKPHGLRHVPKITCAVKVRKLGPDVPDTRGSVTRNSQEQIIREEGLPTIPAKYIRPHKDSNFVILSQEAHVALTDIKKHYEEIHPQIRGSLLQKIYRNACLGIDGIKESLKSSRKLVLITIKLGDCIYPWHVHNPMKGEKECPGTAEAQLRPIMDELLSDRDVRIVKVLADKVERHVMRCLPGVTGKYSCEFCFAPGKDATGRWWRFPSSTQFPKRCHYVFKEIAESVRDQNPEDIDREISQGILGYSPLLDLPGFNILDDVALDEFHLVREVVTKDMLQRIFNQCKTPEAQACFLRVNNAYSRMRVFHQCPRRTRSLLRLPDFKGNELLIVTLTLLPYIFTVGIRERIGKWAFKRRALAIYFFLVRSFFYDDERLEDIEASLDVTLEDLHCQFYRYYQMGFADEKNIKPNLHTFFHLYDNRLKNGPLWKTSTEPFESLYSVIRRTFRPGTPNCPKQIMTNFYLRDKLKHRCRTNFQMKILPDTGSGKFCDSLIRTRDGQIFKVMEVFGKDTFTCHRVVTREFLTPGLNLPVHLPWNLVGLSRFEDISTDDQIEVRREDVVAKVMKCKTVLADWLPEWLTDSKADY